MPKYHFDRIKVLVTSACNSNCTHCFRSKEKNSSTLSQDKLLEIVDFGIDNGCEEFSFSGGEFFTHPFAYGLIEYCISKNVTISILTNALEIDLDFFTKIKNKGLISFQISIDGMREQHDFRRGLNSYDRTIKNVELLHSLGYKLTAKMVLDEYNYMDFIDVIQLPWFNKVLVLPVANFNDSMTSPNSCTNTKMYEKSIMYIYSQLLKNESNVYHCNSFPNELAIKYNGEVFPCTEAREHDEYSMGNIIEESIYNVIQKYENTENKLNCKNIKIEECNSCTAKDFCNQGCRLRALRFHGSAMAPDPFNCRIFKGDFLEIPIGNLFWGKH